MKFTVDVPVYLSVEVEAPDAATAAEAATGLVAFKSERPTSFHWHEGAATLLSSRLLPLAEDNEPDVYLCRGGKLNYVEADGAVTPIGESCQ